MITYIGPATNKIEIEKSLKLAFKVFKKNNKKINYQNKIDLWKIDSNIKLKNLIIIKNKNDVIGLTRIIPRKLKLNNKIFNISGLSSICIDEKYRSKGLSKILINYALEYCKRNQYDLVILFARNFLNHYYNKYGIYGISHYTSLNFKSSDLLNFSNKKYLIKKAKVSDLKKIKKSYEYTYLKCNGIFYREYSFWKYLFIKNNLEKNKIEVLIKDKKFYGYIIRNNNHIYEIGILPITDLNILLRTIKLNYQTIEFDMIQNHPILKNIDKIDFTFKFRQCPYGGHMLKIINTHKLVKYSKVKLNNNDLTKIKKNKIDQKLTMKLLQIINFSNFPKSHSNLNYFSFLNSDHL